MSNPWDDLSKEAQDALIDFGELGLAEAYVDLAATIQRVRSTLRSVERFRDELQARSGYGEGSRQAYINCAKWLRDALDQEDQS